MTAPLWQILVPTLACPTRREFYRRLRSKLDPQLTDDVEIVPLEDDGERTTGEKRQAMLEAATAPWVCFFDDDDLPSDDYVSRIRPVLLASECDLVGFNQFLTSDGRPWQMNAFSYDANNMPGGLPKGVRRGRRDPNHLCPVRRELALRVGFPCDRNAGEDSAYARGLSSLRPRPREHFIAAALYTYEYRSPNRRPREEVETTNEHRRKHVGLVTARHDENLIVLR